ncbi:MAG: YitT family protein [Rikenellaceae bacterium]|nr:YitT family protein [Rikenellaceae bacterium]
MGKFNANSILKVIKEYVLMAVGCAGYSFAWSSIISPAGVIGGGASGLALVIEHATRGTALLPDGLPMGTGFFIINAILITLAVLTVGVKFGAKTIYCIVMISVFLDVFGTFLSGDLLGIADDKMLSTILGAVVAGAGVSLSFHEGGSTGGTDIVWMIINHFKKVSYGKILMLVDFMIIASSYLVYGSISTIIYGFVMVTVFGYTVDMIMAGNKQSSQIFVFSKNYKEIADKITSSLHRGVTILDGVGAYTGNPSKMLVVICRKFETDTILKIVKDSDPNAFLSVGAVMGVYGEGFEALPETKQTAKKKSNKEENK